MPIDTEATDPGPPGLARRMARVSPSPIMELIKQLHGRDLISFASGLPDPALYPVDTVDRLTREVLAEDGRAALQYGPTEGYPPLRETVSALLKERGLEVPPEGVLITSGSQQALDLAARALLDPGDPVVVENPTYLAALQVFDSLEATYLPIGQDADGMATEELPALLARGARLVYTLPNFQNPAGVTLPFDRRRALARSCAEAGVALLEDDAYYGLRYCGADLPAVCSLADNPLALYSGTFSKTIAPGLRVGYLAGHPSTIRRIGQLKQVTDLQAGSLTQRIVHRFCTQGHLSPAVERLRSVYSERLGVMLEEMERHLTGLADWTRPAGGMFIFCRLAHPADATVLLRAAWERGVAFVPGAGFHLPGPDGSPTGRDTLRLNFVSEPPQRIREGVRILGEVIRQHAG